MICTKKWIVSLGVLLTTCMTSCSPPIYYPDRIHSPLFEKEGDMELTGSISFAGYSGSAGYALTDHISVLWSLNHFNRYTDDTTYHNQTVIEGGIGYFGEILRGWQYEVDFTIAHCNLNYANDKPPVSAGADPYHKTDAKYVRYALQLGLVDGTPSIEGAKYYKEYESFKYTYGLLARLSLIHYLSFRDSSYFWPTAETTIKDTRSNQLYLELLSENIFHIWHPYISLEFQFGFVIPLSYEHYENDSYPYMGSLGLRFYFNRHLF